MPRSPFPSKKAITLLKNEPFSVSLSYDDADGRIPPHVSKALGTYRIELPKVGFFLQTWDVTEGGGSVLLVVLTWAMQMDAILTMSCMG